MRIAVDANGPKHSIVPDEQQPLSAGNILETVALWFRGSAPGVVALRLACVPAGALHGVHTRAGTDQGAFHGLSCRL